MNKIFMESARSMITHACLPNSYWAEAVASAAYVRNRVPTTAIAGCKILYEVWDGKQPM